MLTPIGAHLPALSPPAHVRNLDVYQPGKPIEELERELGITGALKVASNENPLGPSPRAMAAVAGQLDRLHLYPDAGGWALRRGLAAHLDVDIAALALGNGSNDLLYQLVLATCEPHHEVVSHEAAFLSYRLSAQVAGRPFLATKPTPQLAVDVAALIAAITPKTRLVLLGSPNNPTGSVVTEAQAQQVLAAMPNDALLVIDEAYCEYAAAWPEVPHVDGVALWRRDPRVVVLRTFSKIYGLAGLRVGYAVAAPAVIELLGRVTRTFSVGSLAQAGALAALGDVEFVARSQTVARRAIEAYQTQFVIPGGKAYPSLANFVLIDVGRPTDPIYQALLRKGVIVRPMSAWGLPTCLRISAAAEADVPRVIAAVNDALAN